MGSIPLQRLKNAVLPYDLKERNNRYNFSTNKLTTVVITRLRLEYWVLDSTKLVEQISKDVVDYRVIVNMLRYTVFRNVQHRRLQQTEVTFGDQCSVKPSHDFHRNSFGSL